MDYTRRSQRMTGSMNSERPVDLHLGFPTRIHRAAEMRGRERNLRELLTFENILVHPFVASSVTAVAAGGINHDFPRCRAGGRIELNRPPLNLERSVNHMENIGKRERGVALRRVKIKDG